MADQVDAVSVVNTTPIVVDTNETKPKTITQIIKTKTADLSPEEREQKLAYFKRHNNTDKHRAYVRKYRAENLLPQQKDREYRERMKQKVAKMFADKEEE